LELTAIPPSRFQPALAAHRTAHVFGVVTGAERFGWVHGEAAVAVAVAVSFKGRLLITGSVDGTAQVVSVMPGI
jgi:hypothetical protein